MDLLRGAGLDDLRAELLWRKARCLLWRPDEAVAVCREALGLLGETSPPRLRLALFDELAAAASDLGDANTARASWLEAQRLSEPSGEAPYRYCGRSARLARAAGAGDGEAQYLAAVWGYRSLDLRHESRRLLVELAEALLAAELADRLPGLDEELARELRQDPRRAAGIVGAAQELGAHMPELATLAVRSGTTASAQGQKAGR